MTFGSRPLTVLNGTGPTRGRLRPPSRVDSPGSSCSNIEVGARSPGFGVAPGLGNSARALALALLPNFWMFSASSCTLGFLRLKGLRERDRC